MSNWGEERTGSRTCAELPAASLHDTRESRARKAKVEVNAVLSAELDCFSLYGAP
jgi:hypothetical protein